MPESVKIKMAAGRQRLEDRHDERRRVPAEFIMRTMHDYALELQAARRDER